MTQGTVLYIKANDTAKPLTITCTDDATIVDFTPATLIKVVASYASTSLPVFAPRVIAARSNVGVVTMPWQVGDTATPGMINVEVQATWPDGTVQTFPNEGYLRVIVERDLG